MSRAQRRQHEILPEEVRNIFLAHTNAQGMLPLVLDMQRSRGIDLYDQRTGRRLMDFFGFYATSALGMNHPGLTEDAAFLSRLQEAALNKVTNSDVQTVHMARFLDTFARVAMPDRFSHAFFISGGALAVENALKVAFDWKVRKNHAKGYKRERGHQVLHLEESFHGRSGYTLSLTNTADPRKTQYFPKFDWPRIQNPKIVWPLEAHLEAVEASERNALEQAKQHFYERKDDVACVIMETIQGEGGDNHFRPAFFEAIKTLCLENDALFILDEVQSGVGITGTFWAFEGVQAEPDLIAFGKKTQVCGILAGPRLDEVADHVFEKSSRINSTWGGNLVDMVRFDRTLEIIEQAQLLRNARTVGAHLYARLKDLAAEFPCISNVRGRGLMCAMNLSDRALRDRVLTRCYDEGVVLLGCGHASIRFRAPLTITAQEVDEGLGRLRAALRRETQ